MKRNLGWILFFVCVSFLGNTMCYSKVRFEGGYGASYLSYKETHEGQASKDVEFTQQSMLFDGAFRSIPMFFAFRFILFSLFLLVFLTTVFH